MHQLSGSISEMIEMNKQLISFVGNKLEKDLNVS
jgi:hypothetical protein